MKWLGGIITSLIILALGTVFVAYLQPIVRAIAPEEGLIAEVELSRWHALPEKAGTTILKPSDQAFIAKARKDSFLFRDFYDFASITIDNPTAKVAENVRVKLANNSLLDALILSDDGLTQVSIKDSGDFKLPNLKPGDRVKLFLWGENQFPKILVSDQIKTYSSLGGMRTTFSAPSDNMYFESENSAFFKFVDEWIGFILGTILIFLIIVTLIGLATYEKYIKSLFNDASFYTDEKARFDADPAKFVIKNIN